MSHSKTSDPDSLVTLLQARSEFEANMTVAILNDAGIEAFAFGGVHAALPLNARLLRVAVQVRAADLEDAKAALESNISDSIDLDWEQVDVGERVDRLPLSATGKMPLVAKIAYLMAVSLLVLTLLALLLSMVF